MAARVLLLVHATPRAASVSRRDATDGLWSYDSTHFEWNFGFNLLELARHRAINFTARYERLASRMLAERFVRGDSLIYGLGESS